MWNEPGVYKVGVLKRVFRFLFACLLRVVYRSKTKGKENLVNIKRHLQEKGSVIFVFNHISLDDSWILFPSLYFSLNKAMKRAIIPVSKTHWDNPVLGRLMRTSYFLGVDAFPVVQHYKRDDYSKMEILRLDKAFMKGIKRTLAQIGGVVFVAPEGRRGSGDGQVQDFQSGIKTLISIAKRNNYNTLIVPIGISARFGFNRTLNLGKQFCICFGVPLPVNKVRGPEDVKESLIETISNGYIDL